MKFDRIHIICVLLFVAAAQCRKPYTPTILVKGDKYLVVDGFINSSPGGVTTILLSRTKKLADTVVNIPEQGATVVIQSAAGNRYALHETGANGRYISD